MALKDEIDFAQWKYALVFPLLIGGVVISVCAKASWLPGTARSVLALVQTPGKSESSAASSAAAMRAAEVQRGVKVLGIKRSAGGYMLDFRFRIVDPEKAAHLLDPKAKPYVIDQASGARVAVPVTPKVGQIRNTTRNNAKPHKDKVYFVFFANPGKFIREGSKVTVVIGDFRLADLVVG